MEFYENYLTKNTTISPVFWHKDGMPDYRKNISNSNVIYKLNSHGLRSDEFIKNHNGEHILFAGCSITCGIGVNIEDTWAYKVYSDFKNSSGFFNVSLPGGSPIEIISNIYKYINLYGNPDYIFILLPPIHRDGRYIIKDHIDKVVYNFYKSLEIFCYFNNIKLLSSSWSSKNEFDFLNNFDTFFEINKSDIDYYGGEILGDDKHHPGPAAHLIWYNEFKKRINYENFRN